MDSYMPDYFLARHSDSPRLLPGKEDTEHGQEIVHTFVYTIVFVLSARKRLMVS